MIVYKQHSSPRQSTSARDSCLPKENHRCGSKPTRSIYSSGRQRARSRRNTWIRVCARVRAFKRGTKAECGLVSVPGSNGILCKWSTKDQKREFGDKKRQWDWNLKAARKKKEWGRTRNVLPFARYRIVTRAFTRRTPPQDRRGADLF